MTAKTASAAPKTAAPKTTSSPKAPTAKRGAKTTASPPAKPKASAPRVAQVQPDVDTAPAAPNLPAGAGLAPSSITPVPFGRLRRAPENVRKTNSAVDIESMADDIGAKGLLQSLIGYPFNPRVENSTIYIVGGGRRLQALALLAERGEIDADWPVPVLIRSQAEAVDLSLSENLGKRDMNPADEFAAFETLMKPGTLSPADLAKRFGFSERYVKQRLRLAGLADEILDALRAGRLTIEAAMAYAGSQDKALQLKVFRTEDKKSWGTHHVQNIRSGIINAQMTTGDALFKFVSARDYEAKGGRYEDDLFGDAETHSGRKLLDGGLIEQIAAERAYFQMARVVADAKDAHATTSDVILAPGLRRGRMPKAPKGYELVDKGYRYDLPDYPVLRDKACKLGIDIIGIASITHAGRLALEEQFFVPGARIKDVIPPQSAAPRKSEAEYATERRAAQIEQCRLFLAAKGIEAALKAGEVEGRRFWADVRPHIGKPVEHAGIGPCLEVEQMLLVTQDEYDRIPFEDAEAEYERQEAERAERVAAKEREKAEAAAALEARKGGLLALDPQPAVVTVDGLDFFRWANGEYWDAVEPEDDADECQAEQSADNLAALIAHADSIGQDWPTIAAWVEYRAAQEQDA
ncbi:ParB N-terminal domain-containing protein [Sphingobium sp. H39-3-25]|uniref:ParB/RepB/Spo0J family partition protein n=1 Tax=Sphingobium arseniciresistens TaxID=3030834 RepID=UPI0023B8E6AB|nr:ParB N-terminal domain-containing protein [Sphingobium arseniciresistens]